MDPMPHYVENSHFDIAKPPNLADAHIGDHPPWEHGLSQEDHATILKNMYHPLSDSMLRSICLVTTMQTHLYQLGIEEGISQGKAPPNAPAGYRRTDEAVARRLMSCHMHSVYQARLRYVFFPEGRVNVYFYNFEDITSYVMEGKLKGLWKLWAKKVPNENPNEAMIEQLFNNVKIYNDVVERVMRQGTGVQLLEALISFSGGGARSISPQHEANWKFVEGLRCGSPPTFGRSGLWQIEREEAEDAKLLKNNESTQ